MQNELFNLNELEKRQSRRRRLLKSGTISPDGIGTCFDCVIRNISDTGVRVKVVAQIGIPKKFRFNFPEEGIDRAAEVVWRTEKEIGAMFVNR